MAAVEPPAEPPPSQAPLASSQEEDEDDVWKLAQLDEFDVPQVPTSSSDDGLKQPASSDKQLPPSALRASLQAILGSGLSARAVPGPSNSRNARVCGFDPTIFDRGRRGKKALLAGAAAGEEPQDTKQDGPSPVVTRLAELRERRDRRFARSESEEELERHEMLELDADEHPFGIGLEPPPTPSRGLYARLAAEAATTEDIVHALVASSVQAAVAENADDVDDDDDDDEADAAAGSSWPRPVTPGGRSTSFGGAQSCVLQCGLEVVLVLASFVDIDFLHQGWCRIRARPSFEAADGTEAPYPAALMANFHRHSWRRGEGPGDGAMPGGATAAHASSEFVSRWFATPLMGGRQFLHEVAVFRLPLPDTDLAADGTRTREGPLHPAGASPAGKIWRNELSLLLEITLEGCSDDGAAMAQARAAGVELTAAGADPSASSAAAAAAALAREAEGPAEGVELHAIARSRMRIAQPLPCAHAFVQAVLQDQSDGIAALTGSLHTAAAALRVTPRRGLPINAFAPPPLPARPPAPQTADAPPTDAAAAAAAAAEPGNGAATGAAAAADPQPDAPAKSNDHLPPPAPMPPPAAPKSLLPPPPPLWSDERSGAACAACASPLAAVLLPWCDAVGASLRATLREWAAEMPSVATHARAAPPLRVPLMPLDALGGGGAALAAAAPLEAMQAATRGVALLWGQVVYALCCCELTPLLRLMRHRHRGLEWRHALARHYVVRPHTPYDDRREYDLTPQLHAPLSKTATTSASSSGASSSGVRRSSATGRRSASAPTLSELGQRRSSDAASSAASGDEAGASAAFATDAAAAATPATPLPLYNQQLAQTLPLHHRPPTLVEDAYAPVPPPGAAGSHGGTSGGVAGAMPPPYASLRTPPPPPPMDAYADLVVLVHGYSGSAYDVRLMRSYLQLQLPRAAFLLSCANEQLVNVPIETMAERLAQEVEGFIVGNGQRLRLQRLSFVAFSIGALVLRAALRLPALRKLEPFMHAFASISGPLIGYPMPSASGVVQSGMWFMANVVKDVTLAQLGLADGAEPARSLVGQVSAAPDEQPRFRHVLLVGSQQDKYVPLYSSLLRAPGADQPTPAGSAKRVELLRKMVDGALESMAESHLVRIDVHFRDKPKQFSLDQFAGRAVHTKFLENVEFLRLFAARFARCFES